LQRFQTLAARNAETQQNVDRQQALVNQIEANIAADQAAIESAQAQLDYTKISAPVDGRMGIVQIDPGNIVHPSDLTPIVTLARVKPATVIFSLPQSNLNAVRQSLKNGPLSVTAYDQDDQEALSTGSVDFIDNTVEQTTGTIRLQGVFDNDREALWPGQFVTVRLRLKVQKGAVTVPSSVIQHGPQGPYAWVVGQDDRAAMRPVEIGAAEQDFTIVSSGLAEGERVAVDGQYKIRPNVHVVETHSSAGVIESGRAGS
jgi:multidrug efflux system membrane fusion protein